MAKCTECLHWDACLYLFKLAIGREPNLKGNRAEECPNFQCRTKYAEVVRCKDCKHCEPAINSFGEKIMECQNNNGIWRKVKPDDFCSYGERSDDHARTS